MASSAVSVSMLTLPPDCRAPTLDQLEPPSVLTCHCQLFASALVLEVNVVCAPLTATVGAGCSVIARIYACSPPTYSVLP